MNLLPLIESKRDGAALSRGQIVELIAAVTARQVPDYQSAALLMAVYFQGLNAEETRDLTLAMRDSGRKLEFPPDARPLVDKHSTGGVGDKVSLPLAPLLACLGMRVPMISGRTLGITGGTLDKLESIPGFSTKLSFETIVQQVQRIGCVICGQSAEMVPADQVLYALRDVTGTVPSIPLITASILSKKLAEGLDALVLDVKFGCAAFMQTHARALELAQTMVELGNECGVRTGALLTNMDRPLGRSAGNWLEVKEAVDCLEGRGPPDLEALVLFCAAHLMIQAGVASTIEDAQGRASTALHSGEPRRKWDQMLAAQGAEIPLFDEKLARDHTAQVVVECRTPRRGYVQRCDARMIGEVVRALGGGRFTKDSTVNHDVGIDQIVPVGQQVQPGGVLARIHAADSTAAERVVRQVEQAFSISDHVPEVAPLIERLVSRAG